MINNNSLLFIIIGLNDNLTHNIFNKFKRFKLQIDVLEQGLVVEDPSPLYIFKDNMKLSHISIKVCSTEETFSCANAVRTIYSLLGLRSSGQVTYAIQFQSIVETVILGQKHMLKYQSSCLKVKSFGSRAPYWFTSSSDHD